MILVLNYTYRSITGREYTGYLKNLKFRCDTMIRNHVKTENILTYRVLCISRGRNERDPAFHRLLLFESLFFPLTDLLHLEHPLHDKLVLALLVGMTLILTFPREKKLRRPALVERNEEMCTLVAVRYGDFLVHHLLPCGYHRLVGSQLHLLIGHRPAVPTNPNSSYRCLLAGEQGCRSPLLLLLPWQLFI